jgi:hypothetical protein
MEFAAKSEYCNPENNVDGTFCAMSETHRKQSRSDISYSIFLNYFDLVKVGQF